ncbi:hypothetical protein QYM36_006332 [Artemia franciscana]|uniref:Ankyrin repeat domain-containing protein 12 n=2 Tax=Artemia franciscana TaxID=6661 RepID=A0AA88HYG7_ARTSF|nr:hypothetical protein QYM36_006332 [Artemia franciscana]
MKKDDPTGESDTGSSDSKYGSVTSKRSVDEDSCGEEQKKRRRRNEEGSSKGRRGSEKSKVSRNTGSKPQLQSSASNNVTSLPSANDSSAVSGVNSFSPKCVKSPETEAEEKRGSDGETGPKVPPLKIVIPSAEAETAVKSGKNRTNPQALPYIVSTSSPTSSDKEGALSPGEEKKDTDSDKSSPNGRVTRSSQKTGVGSSKSPSPPPPSCDPNIESCEPTATPVKVEDGVKTEESHQIEVHPRKRKIRKPMEAETSNEPTPGVNLQLPPVAEQQPFVNCVEMFLKIRKQIEHKRRNLIPVKIKPPQGFKDYLMNRCSYVLAGNASSRMAVAMLSTPQNLSTPMQELFTQQEKERYKLRMQHLVEKEKLVLSVEQEILRVHGRAARASANQSLPYSACTILRDEEVYNPITPEQEAKEINARSRFTGRLLLSWLQDVDDKWEKIKESMLLRHHNEAESLHAVQKMDWEWRLKETGLCEPKARAIIDDTSVPMVQVSDDFDLLQA